MSHVKMEELMTRYAELKKRLKKINIGVVKLDKWYQAYFLTGIHKDQTLSNVPSLDSLEKLCEINNV